MNQTQTLTFPADEDLHDLSHLEEENLESTLRNDGLYLTAGSRRLRRCSERDVRREMARRARFDGSDES